MPWIGLPDRPPTPSLAMQMAGGGVCLFDADEGAVRKGAR